MGRYFAAVALALTLLPAPFSGMPQAEPAFFSMLFPQLIPPFMLEDAQTPGWKAVAL